MAPEIRRAALYEGASRSFVEIGKEAGAQIVSPVFHLVTPEQVKAAMLVGRQPLNPSRPQRAHAIRTSGNAGRRAPPPRYADAEERHIQCGKSDATARQLHVVR